MTLVLKDVSYIFPNEKKPIISRLNLTVNDGEFVSLIGKSGSGKSTLLKLITGLLRENEGEISHHGNPISLGDVGYMPQRDLLLPWRSIIDNILIATEIQKDHSLSKNIAREWLERVGLIEYENAFPNQLSGGMRQRVSFLRAMLTGKDLLLLDEPFGALDAMTKKEMQNWLLSIWKELDKTILFITHDLEEACYLSDRVIILQSNQVIEDIKVDLPRPRHPDMLHSNKLVTLRRDLEKKIPYAQN